MRERKLERAFERFRRHGDVTALGDAFDAAAPELLRVAASLASRLAEAEDLVQATFLTAIERAERWERSQRLMPWLLGILVRHAHEARRGKRREEGVSADEPSQRDEALEGLERTELAEELERALDTLPKRERDVLRPFLVDGRAPVEIARERGEAPGTVRMRIHRGLERLRRALPAGLGLGLAAELGGGRGLAAVRAEVLTSAAASPVVLGAATTSSLSLGWILGGGLVVKNIALASVALALALGLAWIAWPSGARAPAVVEEEQQPLARGKDARGGPASDPAAPLVEAPVRRAETSAGPASEASLFERSLSGVSARLLTHAREPVAHTEVALLELRPGMLTGVWDALRAGEPAPIRIEVDRARTDAAGRFTLRGARTSGLHAIGVDLGGPRATLVFLDRVLNPAEVAELGDVVLEPAGRIVGTVVDEVGQPLPGALVRAAKLPRYLLPVGLLRPGAALAYAHAASHALEVIELPAWMDAWYARLPIPTVRSDERGRFTLESVLAGEVSLIVFAPGRPAHVRPGLTVPAGETCEVGATALVAGRSLSGRVVDAAGAIVSGVELRAGTAPSLTGAALESLVLGPIERSEAEGRFRFEGLSGGELVYVALRRAPGLGWELQDPIGVQDEVELVLPTGASLELELRSAAGEPIADATVALAPSGPMAHDQAPAGLSSLRVARGLQRAGPGLVRMSDVPTGAYRLRVGAPGYADTWTDVEVESGSNRAQLELAPARALLVRVLDAESGAPVADCELSVHVHPSREPALEGARSDALGAAHFARIPAGSEPALELRVEHPAYALWREPLAAGASEVEVRLGRGGALEAFIHRSGLASAPPVLLEIDGLRIKGADPVVLGTTDARGRVRMERLPAGEYRYSVRERFAGQGIFELIEGFDHASPELAEGRFLVAEGETTRLELALGAGAGGAELPARISGRLTLDGEPLADLTVELMGNGDRMLRAFSDEGGRYELDGLSAGRAYLVVYDAREGAADPSPLGRGFQHAERLELASGESRLLDFDWRSHAVEVRVLGTEGEPVARVDVTLRSLEVEDGSIVARALSDDEGLARLRVTRSGAWLATARATRHGAGEVELLVAGPRTSAVLELDPGIPCAGEVVLPEGVALAQLPTLLVISQKRGLNYPVTLERREDRLGFRAVGLQAGEYVAQLMTTEARFSTLRFALPARGHEALELRFELQRADAKGIRRR